MDAQLNTPDARIQSFTTGATFLFTMTEQNSSDDIENYTFFDENMTTINMSDLFGPKRDSLLIVIPITIIYAVIFVTGIVGNISTCIVIRKNRSMHTATNYYLFSLAISDFLLLLSGVPQEMYFIWSKYPYVFGEWFCIGRGFVAETSANATVLTITAFTAERYVAICHPFLAQAMSKLSRATRIILLIWLTSFMTAIPQAAQFGLAYQYGVSQCMVLRVIIKHSFQLSTFMFFFAPMSIIFVLYLLIGLKLYQTSLVRSSNGNVVQRVKGNNSLRSQNSHGTKRVLKMLVAVVIAFFICWAPFHAQRLIAVYGTDPKDPLIIKLYTIMTYVSGVLYYLSTCINPLLYNIMSNKFRQAFKETLNQWNTCSPKTYEPKRKYNVLSRPKRLRFAFQESTECTSSSQRDESFQSTSSGKLFTMTSSNQRCITRPDKLTGNVHEDFLYREQILARNINSKRNMSEKINNGRVGSMRQECRDIVVKIDELDLPSKDASLNVLYTKQGHIQIRLHKKPQKYKGKRRLLQLLTNFARVLKTRPSPTHMGFYTPPIDDDMSMYELNVSEKLSTGSNSKGAQDDVSNSSLKDVDHIALAGEHSSYYPIAKS